MAKLFNDGFDHYAATADLAAGKWSSTTSIALNATTAFGGQSLATTANNLNNVVAIWETATNETTVFFSIRYRTTNATGASITWAMQFTDAGTAQVTIMFMQDFTIVARSGGTGGTVLGTASAATTQNTWDSFQGKIVINNTTGSVELRKNGGTTPILNLTSVNTRGGTANNYVNRVTMGSNFSNQSVLVDDMFFNSDNGSAPTTWPGDVRLLYINTAGPSSAQFSTSPTTVTTTYQSGGATSQAKSANTAYTIGAFAATSTGTVGTATVSLNGGFTGNMKVALYASDGTAGAPGTLMATSNAVVNPVNGANTFTFASPPSVVNGTNYYLGLLTDTAFNVNRTASSVTWYSVAQSYGSGFPAGSAMSATTSNAGAINSSIVITTVNWYLVSDTLNDGDTTYIFDSTVGHKDIFTIAGLGAVNPASIIGVDVHVNWKKSDAGARGGTVGVDANGSGDTAVTGITNVTPSLSYVSKFGWMPLDPTGAAWTTSNINSMKISASVAS